MNVSVYKPEPDDEADQHLSPTEKMFEAVKNNDIEGLTNLLEESDDSKQLTTAVHLESGSTALMLASRVFDNLIGHTEKCWLLSSYTCLFFCRKEMLTWRNSS